MSEQVKLIKTQLNYTFRVTGLTGYKYCSTIVNSKYSQNTLDQKQQWIIANRLATN